MGMRVVEDVERGEEKKESRERRASEMMMKWRERWETSLKGRVTFGYMESVRIGTTVQGLELGLLCDAGPNWTW